MTENGPFNPGDRVAVPALSREGVVRAEGEAQEIKISGDGRPDEPRTVRCYEIEFDDGDVRTIYDRENHILRR